MLNLHFKC